MKYLLLMYHPKTYWNDHTEERAYAEESAFTEFCMWMRENGISWDAMALEPPEVNHVRTFDVGNAISQLLPEVADVITGLFVLSVPNDALLSELLERCPHISGTRLEIRKIAD